MDRRNIIYIGIISVFCLVTLYYFYRSSFDLSKDVELSDSVEQPNYPSFTRSKGDLKQESRVPEDQETKQDGSETSDEDNEIDDEEGEPEDIEAFFDGWDIQRNSFGGITSVMSSSKEKNIPLPDDENSQTGNVLLWAQDVAPLFGGRSNQISNSSQIRGTDLMKHYSFKQVIDSYEVYGGALQVSVNQTDGSVFSVINSLKVINVESFHSSLNYNQEQAWERVRSGFPSATQINAEQHGRPQLFVRGSVQELAWVFDVRTPSVTGQPDVRRVVVGGVSGNILENLSTIVH